jgi:mannose-6-phosphate isomerase-like protein (cupin superfamily)
MTRSSSLVVALVATLVAGLTVTAWSSPARAAQQSDPQTETLMQFTLEDAELPLAPTFVRLLRITLEPGAKSPLHTHPGPEFNLIESGTFRVLVQGKALWDERESGNGSQATPTTGPVQPPDGEFVMRAGGSIVYMPGTALTFRNSGSKNAVMLAAVILPAGNQAPPGLVWVGQAPTAEETAGLTSTILGDGVATELPSGQTVVRVERMTLKGGQAIPATAVPTLLSLEKGAFAFTVKDGSVQVSRTADPGPKPDAAIGSNFSLAPGDAAFFPMGNAEIDRSKDKGDLTVLRLTISPASSAAAATPVAGQQGVVEMTAPPTPSPTPEPTVTPTPAASPSPTAKEITEGATVVVTGDTVNLRSGPSTTADVVAQVTKGQVMKVTGPSQQGDNYTWWPVQDVNDASIAGFIASEFIEVQQ